MRKIARRNSDDIRRPLKGRGGGLYFTSTKAHILCVDSGCELLNCVFGSRGYPLGRMVNIVGDKSTGKTLLGIEAMANFRHKFPEGEIDYAETEAAFDDDYAKALGMDMSNVRRPEVYTVEALFKDMEAVIKRSKGQPTLYIVDSLDALSDEAEQRRDISEGSYNMTKQKKLGELFRRLVKPLEQSKVLLIIISQVRDNIGVAFGEKHIRSGGKALDFYASLIVWLANMGQIKKTIGKVTRTVGIKIKAKCKKNKIGLPFRECEFEILFGYGLNDVKASLDFLKGADPEAYRELDTKDEAAIRRAVRAAWNRIETAFLPKKGKYV